MGVEGVMGVEGGGGGGAGGEGECWRRRGGVGSGAGGGGWSPKIRGGGDLADIPNPRTWKFIQTKWAISDAEDSGSASNEKAGGGLDAAPHTPPLSREADSTKVGYRVVRRSNCARPASLGSCCT